MVKAPYGTRRWHTGWVGALAGRRESLVVTAGSGRMGRPALAPAVAFTRETS
jgi:hypothetical protein